MIGIADKMIVDRLASVSALARGSTCRSRSGALESADLARLGVRSRHGWRRTYSRHSVGGGLMRRSRSTLRVIARVEFLSQWPKWSPNQAPEPTALSVAVSGAMDSLMIQSLSTHAVRAVAQLGR